jgi:hypothetical protein
VVSNFDTAFQDGSVFFHMVKKHRPDLLPSEPASMAMVWRALPSPAFRCSSRAGGLTRGVCVCVRVRAAGVAGEGVRPTQLRMGRAAAHFGL